MQKYIFKFFVLAGIVACSLAGNQVHAATPLVSSLRITSANTVTIVFSESVYTSLNDYSTFTGSLSGKSLTSLSGSGTNVVTLTFSGGTFTPDATGGLTISSSVSSVSDGSSLGAGPYTATDGQTPQLKSFSVSSDMYGNTVARTGNVLTISFYTNETVNSSPYIVINNNSITTSGSGSGPFTATYTMSSSDTQDIVSVAAHFTDTAGNQGSGSFMLGSGLGPKIVSVTSNATSTGALRVGDSITFVLTLASAAPGAYVYGYYNGSVLSWTTGNGGITYTATYTVKSSDTSTYTPVQITGVKVTDSSGNVSTAASGTDIQKTINTQSFNISEITPVSSYVTTQTPSYAFYSPQDGTITWGGDCSSYNMSATAGTNYVTLKTLSYGTHSNCTVTVTNAAGYASNTLTIPTFTIGTVSSSASSSSSSSSETSSSSVNSSSHYKFYNPLKLGSKGTDVTKLQERLSEEGYYSGPVTGYYGSLTVTAVKKYQKAHGLTQLGSVGPGTRSSLNAD